MTNNERPVFETTCAEKSIREVRAGLIFFSIGPLIILFLAPTKLLGWLFPVAYVLWAKFFMYWIKSYRIVVTNETISYHSPFNKVKSISINEIENINIKHKFIFLREKRYMVIQPKITSNKSPIYMLLEYLDIHDMGDILKSMKKNDS